MLTLYRAHSVLSDLSGRHDVTLQWFRVGRSQPVLPYEELIDYQKLEADAKDWVRQGHTAPGSPRSWLASLGAAEARARRHLPELELDPLFSMLEWGANALLTAEELQALQAYLGARHALDVVPEAVAVPLTEGDRVLAVRPVSSRPGAPG
jgi:hypothetical protein